MPNETKRGQTKPNKSKHCQTEVNNAKQRQTRPNKAKHHKCLHDLLGFVGPPNRLPRPTEAKHKQTRRNMIKHDQSHPKPNGSKQGETWQNNRSVARPAGCHNQMKPNKAKQSQTLPNTAKQNSSTKMLTCSAWLR